MKPYTSVYVPKAESLLSVREEAESHARRLTTLAAKLHPLEGSDLYQAAAWIRVVNRLIGEAFEELESRNAS